MQASNKHNSKEELFSQAISRKLDDFRLPIEDGDWLAMHNRIKQEKRKKVMSRLLWMGSSIAAVGLLLFYFISIPSLPLDEEFTSFIEEMPFTGEIEEETIPELLVNAIDKPHKLPVKKILFPFLKEQEVENNDEKDGVWVLSREDNSEQNITEEQPMGEEILSMEPYWLGATLEGPMVVISIPRKKRWQISTGIAGGGGINSDGFWGNSDLDYSFMDPGSWEDGTPPTGEEEAIFTKTGHREIQDIWDQRNYSETHHSLPVSFSFMVRNKLSKKVSIETGLVYTYLSSRMEQYGSERVTTRVKQHYIGIPLTMRVEIWHYIPWRWYISGGGMVEKGVRLAVNEEIITQGKNEYVERRSGIDGVQASIQISSGIEYAISHHWSLYVEPRFSYYFDNNQPVSMRTDKSVIVSLGGGLRYSF